MKEYRYKVCLCDGHYCNGYVTTEGETEEEAHDNAEYYVLNKLADAFPELGIDVYIELAD